MGLSQFPPAAGGIPTGNTAARPASPVIGDVYYNGQLGILEIYDGTNWVPCSAPAAVPTIAVADVGTSVAYGSAQGAVTITPGTAGGKANSFLISSSTGGYTATTSGTTVTITVGNNGSWTFSGQGVNSFGTSVAGPAISQTLTTVPQAPTIGTASTSGVTSDITVTWTLNSNGGKNLTAIEVVPYLNGTTAQTATTAATTTATSATITGLTGGSSYTFKVKAINANGTGLESSASNSITVPAFFTADYLVVAGGGGGEVAAGGRGGGGGAGGMKCTVTATGGSGSLPSGLSVVTSTNYTVTVGAGGSNTNNGNNSVFSTVTATGGGKGGAGNTTNGPGQVGSNGGSGGGGGADNMNTTGNTAGGTGNSDEGYAGGSGRHQAGAWAGGGGGGGAAAVGVSLTVNGDQFTPANGGAGRATSITGTSVTYAGGGGGQSAYGSVGAGGAGGGGAGNNSGAGSGTNGSANTGGGGGGGNSSGGSGIVVLRYPNTRTITVGAGLTAGVTNQAVGTNERYTTLTAGSGNVSWS